jgi:hypothetical protein
MPRAALHLLCAVHDPHAGTSLGSSLAARSDELKVTPSIEFGHGHAVQISKIQRFSERQRALAEFELGDLRLRDRERLTRSQLGQVGGLSRGGKPPPHGHRKPTSMLKQLWSGLWHPARVAAGQAAC